MFVSRHVSLLLLAFFFAATATTPTAAAEDAPVCKNDDDDDCSKHSQEQEHNSKAWFEDGSSDGKKFLQEKVFGQKASSATTQAPTFERGNSFSLLSHSTDEKDSDDDKPKPTSGDNSKGKDGKGNGILSAIADIATSEDPATALWEFLLDQSAAAQDDAQNYKDTAKLFVDNAQEIMDQLKRVVGDKVNQLMQEDFYLPSAWYLLRYEQTKKHAYWKSEQHKFMPKVTDPALFRELHLGLYMSDLAYADDEKQVREGLAAVDNGNWELLFVDTQGNPSEPAHFLAVEKQAAPMEAKKDGAKDDKKKGFWKRAAKKLEEIKGNINEEDTLKVMLVVRGTKTMADILSDGLFEAKTYREIYKAHGGIQKSGHYIVEKHIGRLKQLMEVSGRSKIQLLLFGHSLGCGTAAIAAMEFHDNYKDFLSVRSVGFGCPSLISPELSEQYKEIITTVVCDADVVPRLAGSSIVNLHLAMISLDWTEYMRQELRALGADVLKDVDAWTNGKGTKFAQDILDKVGMGIEKSLTETVKPNIKKAIEHGIPKAMAGQPGVVNVKEARRGLNENTFTNTAEDLHDLDYRVETELIPPGTCLHLYRTATGFEAAYTPCSYFDEIEYVPHLVDDHLAQSGYHYALLTLLRQTTNDFNAVFDEELFSSKKPE